MARRCWYTTILALFFLGACATSSPVERYAASKSHFNQPPVLMEGKYGDGDLYRIYQRAGTGFLSIQSLRDDVEQRASFAARQGKSFVVVGERISEPPYILGNFPRIEIVFALIEVARAGSRDKYAELEKLKKLLDEGALTQAEFDAEKDKVLRE
jgi:hypothetical protein